jgi:hypothetical protein
MHQKHKHKSSVRLPRLGQFSRLNRELYLAFHRELNWIGNRKIDFGIGPNKEVSTGGCHMSDKAHTALRSTPKTVFLLTLG